MGKGLVSNKILLRKMQEKQPLILTLKLDDESQAYFDEQRQRHFPPGRNFLRAHLTLFHQLPNDDGTKAYLADIVHPIFFLQTIGLMHRGAGVAYSIDSPDLHILHQKLSNHFASTLTPQDLQPFRPHITIMNKSTPEKAHSLLQSLSTTVKLFAIQGIGLDLWTYLGGPWRYQQTVYFTKS